MASKLVENFLIAALTKCFFRNFASLGRILGILSLNKTMFYKNEKTQNCVFFVTNNECPLHFVW
ncbi:hypothetical protein ACM44_00095 [Chryseobacterium koreense CCUG 49689]|uniref:Uncharacterized protein n=1 Tax=Chryseobacterium koreense CCUG 49689 TaxID=1304281 RepID=A0A0J7J3K4_9FLAO|nr:hypothetical protein ACM44_00095 [Chryseobacterium koreense CCUG 49689]